MNQSNVSQSPNHFLKRSIPLRLLLASLAIAASFWILTSQQSANGQAGNESDKAETEATSKEVATIDDSAAGEIAEPAYQPKSKSQLKRGLTSIQYRVTQSEDTEPAFRNKYWDNKNKGLYRCVVCGQSLFSSTTKFKSGTGWPSFWAPIKKTHVGYKDDSHLFYTRTEVHCSRCKAHLGHVFNDGPKQTTGKRYCMNSASLKFVVEDKIERTKASKDKTADAEQ